MKKLMRIAESNQTIFIHILFWILFISFIPISKVTFLSNFTTEQQLTIGLLAFAFYLWITSPIPSGATSILILACLLMFNLVGSVEEAVVGFLSPALYFILMLTIISQSLVKAGIDRVIARIIIKASKGGPFFIVIGLPIFIAILPILLPSAFARFKILFPIINRLNEYYSFQDKSLFKKYCMYVIGMMNQTSTMVIFTGGGYSVLAIQLFNDYNVANLGWMDWFVMVAPPLWLGLLIVNLFVWQFLKYTTPGWNLTTNDSVQILEQDSEPIPPVFWIITSSFMLMIITWIVTDHERVPLLLPPMFY